MPQLTLECDIVHYRYLYWRFSRCLRMVPESLNNGQWQVSTMGKVRVKIPLRTWKVICLVCWLQLSLESMVIWDIILRKCSWKRWIKLYFDVNRVSHSKGIAVIKFLLSKLSLRSFKHSFIVTIIYIISLRKPKERSSPLHVSLGFFPSY